MRLYDYSFLREEKIDNKVLKIYIEIEKQASLLDFNAKLYPEVIDKIKEVSTFQSTKYSSMLDGVSVPDSKLRSIVENVDLTNTKKDIQIGMFYQSLKFIFDSFDSIQFNSYGLRDLHNTLLSRIDSSNGGYYKDQDNFFQEVLEDNTKRVICDTVRSSNTQESISNLIEAFNIAYNDEYIPKLMLIPCVIFDFLMIHPFQKHNEKLSRLLSTLLLLKSGYKINRFVSFEKHIYKEKDEYYNSVRKASVNWKSNQNDYNPFIYYFLSLLKSSYIEFNNRFKIVDGEKVNKKTRIEETIKMSFQPISRKEIHLIWPDISHETIKKVIKDLLLDNKIKKIGNYKDARYKRNWYGDRSEDEENIVIF